MQLNHRFATVWQQVQTFNISNIFFYPHYALFIVNSTTTPDTNLVMPIFLCYFVHSNSGSRLPFIIWFCICFCCNYYNYWDCSCCSFYIDCHGLGNLQLDGRRHCIYSIFSYIVGNIHSGVLFLLVLAVIYSYLQSKYLGLSQSTNKQKDTCPQPTQPSPCPQSQ